MNEGYAYTTVKKVYNILTDYFRYLTQQEYIPKNPMAAGSHDQEVKLHGQPG